MIDSIPSAGGPAEQPDQKPDPAVDRVRRLLANPDAQASEMSEALDALERRLDDAFVRGLAPRR